MYYVRGMQVHGAFWVEKPKALKLQLVDQSKALKSLSRVPLKGSF